MNKIFLLLLLIPAFSYGQYTYTFKDISGKWTERTRTDKNSDVTPFKDTLYIELREDGFMMIRHTIGPTYFGDAELFENKLSIQKESFTIEGLDKGMLKLKQGKVTHRFVKFDEFVSAPVEKVIPGVETGAVVTDFETLRGTWHVYKKTDPTFNKANFYIKLIEFKEKQKNNSYTGIVTYHSTDSVYNTTATFNISESEFNLISPAKMMKATLLKSNGDEIILEHGKIRYFLKK